MIAADFYLLRVELIRLTRRQSCPQSLRYPYPAAEWATDALEEPKAGTTKSRFRFNCACVKLFTHLMTKRSSRGNFALLAHWYIIVPKQFFFTWPLIDVSSNLKGLSKRPKKNICLFKMLRLRALFWGKTKSGFPNPKTVIALFWQI